MYLILLLLKNYKVKKRYTNFIKKTSIQNKRILIQNNDFLYSSFYCYSIINLIKVQIQGALSLKGRVPNCQLGWSQFESGRARFR